MLLLYTASNDIMIFSAALLYGFGFGAIFPAIQTWCINLVGEHEDAMASFFNFFDLGIGGGSFLLGLIAAAGSYQPIFIFTALIYGVFLVAYVGYVVKRRQRVLPNATDKGLH
ncbi:hypothetical protein JCM19029_08300 [Salinicoccus sesuvii]